MKRADWKLSNTKLQSKVNEVWQHQIPVNPNSEQLTTSVSTGQNHSLWLFGFSGNGVVHQHASAGSLACSHISKGMHTIGQLLHPCSIWNRITNLREPEGRLLKVDGEAQMYHVPVPKATSVRTLIPGVPAGGTNYTSYSAKGARHFK